MKRERRTEMIIAAGGRRCKRLESAHRFLMNGIWQSLRLASRPVVRTALLVGDSSDPNAVVQLEVKDGERETLDHALQILHGRAVGKPSGTAGFDSWFPRPRPETLIRARRRPS